VLTERYSGDQSKKVEVGGACSSMGRGEVDKGFWWGYVTERDHLEDLGVDGRIQFKCIFKCDAGHGECENHYVLKQFSYFLVVKLCS